MNCRKCLCPITNLMGGSGGRENRAYCTRCQEALAPPPAAYGTRPLDLRLRKREAKRLWAQRNRELIYDRKKQRVAADPEKTLAAKREYRRRWEARRKAGMPPIRDTEPRGEE